MEYAEFRLVIRAAADGACVVSVDESPCGGAILPRPLTFTWDDVAALLARLDPGSEPREIDQEPAAPTGVRARHLAWDQAWRRETGCFLFDSLFHGKVRACLRHSLATLRVHQAQGRGPTALRIRLHFGAPGDPAAMRPVAHLAALPWELLYDPERGDYLCLQASTPIVRTLDAPFYVPYPFAIDPPLRVLVVAALPQGQAWLNLDREIERLVAELADTDAIELKLLTHATFPALKEELLNGAYHVFHFMGHGREGQLLLESPGPSADITIAVLAELIRGHSSLRLAVLNACKSARIPDPKFGAHLSGVAAGLVGAGIPAVAAMQFSIGDSPAIDFATAFYRSLARNEPLELAVTRGRRAIMDRAVCRARETDAAGADSAQKPAASRQAMESLTPVLYSRTRAGRLFDVLPVVEVFGIRFRKVGGIHLAERPLTAEDWARIDPTEAVPEPGPTIAWINQVFKNSKTRAQQENRRVAGLRLPSEAELRAAPRTEVVYYYCTTDDPIFRYAAMTPGGKVKKFQDDGWNKIYSLHCFVRPVVDLVSDATSSHISARWPEESHECSK